MVMIVAIWGPMSARMASHLFRAGHGGSQRSITSVNTYVSVGGTR